MPNSIKKIYLQECEDRMIRARLAMEACGNKIGKNECYNRVHQEFDSLSGAARTVGDGFLEKYARTAAMYARFLRNQVAEERLLEDDHRQLNEGITLLCHYLRQSEKDEESLEAYLKKIKLRMNVGCE